MKSEEIKQQNQEKLTKAVDRNSVRYREYVMKKAALIKIVVFLAFICVGAAVSVMMPLRPTESVYEKRKLTGFPEFTVAAFLNGSYFEKLDLWFADTFPFREQLIVCSEAVDNIYGFRTNIVHGGVVAGDDIPDVDLNMEDFLTMKPVDGNMGNGSLEEEPGTVISGEGSENNQDIPFNEMDISADDVGTDVEDTDGSKAAQAGESLGSIFVVGDSAYSYYVFSQSTSDDYVDVVNNMADRLSGKAAVYNMIVPTSIDIALDDATRNSITSSNQQKAIFYMYSRMNTKVGKTYVYDALKFHRNEYIYFRTDHHWTADGAYYAYATLMNQLGKEPAGLDRFERLEFTDFKGSFFTQTGVSILGDNPDKIIAYRPLSTNNIKFYNRSYDLTDYNIVTDVTDWDSTSKYSTFIGGDNPLSMINNPQINDGSSILVIKESFGNAVVPFLTESFENVYVIDYRYYRGTVSEFVEQYDVDTVVFINNVAATSTQARVDEMKAVCR